MSKIITNKDIGYVRVERGEVVFQQCDIYPDVIDAIEEIQEENKQYESDIKKLMYDIENLERLEKQHQEINGKLREENKALEERLDYWWNRCKELEESGK